MFILREGADGHTARSVRGLGTRLAGVDEEVDQHLGKSMGAARYRGGWRAVRREIGQLPQLALGEDGRGVQCLRDVDAR